MWQLWGASQPTGCCKGWWTFLTVMLHTAISAIHACKVPYLACVTLAVASRPHARAHTHTRMHARTHARHWYRFDSPSKHIARHNASRFTFQLMIIKIIWDSQIVWVVKYDFASCQWLTVTRLCQVCHQSSFTGTGLTSSYRKVIGCRRHVTLLAWLSMLVNALKCDLFLNTFIAWILSQFCMAIAMWPNSMPL